jgi:peptide/nickel transport system permease protein
MVSKRYLAHRSGQTILTLLAVITFLFFLFRAMPGTYADIMLAQGAPSESVAAFEERWGLNDPIYIQYLRYIWNLLHLDAGTSLYAGVPVVKFVGQRMFNTLILAGPGVVMGYFLAIGFGSLMGNMQGSFIERFGTIPVIIFGTMPEFFSSILLLVVFADFLQLFPSGGMFSIDLIGSFENWWEPYLSESFAWHYILPFTAVVMRKTMQPLLVMRTSIVEVLGQDFIYFHRMTGIPKFERAKHVTKHSILPVITLFPISMVQAISGLVLIEIVFNWPGIGFTLVRAVARRDFPVVQFVFILAAAFVIFMNFFIDILYGYIDPRVEVGEDTSTM